MPYLPCHYLYISFIYCTCWVPTISVLNLAVFPCYSNLLLRRRRWTGILRWGVIGYVLPRLSFLWGYGVFRCSILLRVVLVFKDKIYVIIILYIHDIWLSVDTFGRMCGTIDPGSGIRWVLGFGIKIGYDNITRGISVHTASMLEISFFGRYRQLSPTHLDYSGEMAPKIQTTIILINYDIFICR
jgi:hypothetical protein